MKFEDLIYSECMNAASVQISICRIHVLAENTNTSFIILKKSSELEGRIFKILYMDS